MNGNKIKVNNSIQGEMIEVVLWRAMNENAPIKNTIEPIYTERKDGVKPELDIRTDKWEIAQNAMSWVEKSQIAKRMKRIEERDKNGKPVSTQATEN